MNESFLKKNAVWVIALVAIIVFGYLLFGGLGNAVNNKIDESTTITGNFVCLPLEGGVADAEGCELGLKSKEGDFYALDISRIQDANTDLSAEDTIAVTGVVQSDKMNDAPEWDKYEIKNVILVYTLLRTR